MSLKEVIKFGYQENLFKHKPLKDIEHSVCSFIDRNVIDFDYTKERYTKIANLQFMPKSCDCLIFDLENEKAIFIEIKSLEKFKKWHIERREREEHGKVVDKQLSKFNLPKKIESSVSILEEIIKMSGTQPPDPIKVESIILTDMRLLDDTFAEEFIEFTLLYLSDETLSPDYIIQYQLENILDMECDINDKPYLMTCTEIQAFLENVKGYFGK